MTSLRDVRAALRVQLNTVAGLRGYDVWPGTINPPVAIVRPLSGTYHDDFDGSATYRFEVTVLLQLGTLEVAQEQMDTYIASDGPFITALEASPALGGAADNVTVQGWRDYGVMTVGADGDGNAPSFMGCKFDLEVLA